MPRRSAGRGKYGPSIVVFGIRWHLNDTGYYRSNRGVLLHRVVYEKLHGITLHPRQLVHHLDKNRTNNAPENLVLVTHGEHKVLHGAHRWSPKERDRLSRQRREYWEHPKRRRLRCPECGTRFWSSGMRAKYCRRLCWRRAYNRNHAQPTSKGGLQP